MDENKGQSCLGSTARVGVGVVEAVGVGLDERHFG